MEPSGAYTVRGPEATLRSQYTCDRIKPIQASPGETAPTLALRVQTLISVVDTMKFPWIILIPPQERLVWLLSSIKPPPQKRREPCSSILVRSDPARHSTALLTSELRRWAWDLWDRVPVFFGSQPQHVLPRTTRPHRLGSSWCRLLHFVSFSLCDPTGLLLAAWISCWLPQFDLMPL